MKIKKIANDEQFEIDDIGGNGGDEGDAFDGGAVGDGIEPSEDFDPIEEFIDGISEKIGKPLKKSLTNQSADYEVYTFDRSTILDKNILNIIASSSFMVYLTSQAVSGELSLFVFRSK